MMRKKYLAVRVLIGLLIAVVVFVAVAKNNFYLALTGILVGVLFMFLAKVRFKEITVDERVVSVSGKAARATYMIVTLFLALIGLMSIFSSRNGGSYFEEAVGMLMCYIAMLLIAVYSISFYFFNKKYGGDK